MFVTIQDSNRVKIEEFICKSYLVERLDNGLTRIILTHEEPTLRKRIEKCLDEYRYDSTPSIVLMIMEEIEKEE